MEVAGCAAGRESQISAKFETPMLSSATAMPVSASARLISVVPSAAFPRLGQDPDDVALGASGRRPGVQSKSWSSWASSSSLLASLT